MKAKSAHRVTARSSNFPLLENGDHMNQAEFHRRYEQCPADFRAELIGGIVFVSSPMRWPHASHHIDLGAAFWLYCNATFGVEALNNATTILGDESEPQPDLSLRILTEWGGQSQVNVDEYIVGAPELAAEIAHSTRNLDLNRKKLDYQRAGVQEYVVVCVEDGDNHWFDFKRRSDIKPDKAGIFRSRVFPGLWIDGRAILEGDGNRVAEVVQMGITSRAHATFVKQLNATHKKLSGS